MAKGQSKAAIAAPRKRRTQAERRATTRTALLDAALVSLVEDGYANMTTRGVAQRAGVSQGTQQHYFATKADFVLEAMRYAVAQMSQDVLQRIDVRSLRDPEEQERLLDEAWRLHKTPAFKAALELWIAARTDDELRRQMRKLEREVVGIVGGIARAMDDAAGPLRLELELVDIALATVRGYAMLAPVVPQAELERRWDVARGHILHSMRDRLGADDR